MNVGNAQSNVLSQQENMAIDIGNNVKTAEDNLMTAYSLKDGPEGAAAVEKLGQALGLTGEKLKQATPRSLQLIAEQRFQQSTQVFSLFSNLMDKIDQMKQRVISKMSN